VGAYCLEPNKRARRSKLGADDVPLKLRGLTRLIARGSRQSASIMVLLALAACGGGGRGNAGSQSNAPPPPSPPTVALSSSTALAVAGSSVTLTWSSTNAPSCTASGGWSGTKAPAGSESVGPLNSNSTYTLSCNGAAGTVSQSVTVSVNQPPVVAISANTAVTEYTKVTLDGTSSRDPDGQIASYAWEQTAGPTVSLINPTPATAYFVAPHLATATDLSFQLTVVDNQGASTSGNITVHVRPATSADLTVSFLSFTFLEKSTAESHSEYFPVESPPLVGEVRMARAVLSGQIATVNFTVKDTTGTVNQWPVSLAYDASTPPYTYIGSVQVPTLPFSITASGTTRDGQTFTVTAARMIGPQTLRLGFYPAMASAKAGDTLTVQVQVTNGGAADTFNVSFSDPFQLLTKSYDTALQIAGGAVATVSLELLIPAGITSTPMPAITAVTTAQSDAARIQAGKFTLLLDLPP
jgi:K319-like protein